MQRMEKHTQTMAGHWLKLLVCSLMMMNTQVRGSNDVEFTFLESAVSKGAVCLNGSPPAYSYVKGYGEGASNWVVFLEGGGWCHSKRNCQYRAKSMMGSSLTRGNKTAFSGLLYKDKLFNPDFYNWNKVFIVYCDGSSFMSDIEEVDPETNVTYRGARIFNAVMEDLLAKGMKDAKNAVLAGTSAGGLATILHCDYFRGLIPNASRVKCISDSGFFIHAKNLPGAKQREDYYANIVATHRLANFLPASCSSKMNASLCLFPENLVGDIQTPLFILESAFDSFQIDHNYMTLAFNSTPEWNECNTNLTRCTSTQIQNIKDFRVAFIETLQKLDNRTSSRGMFVHSCYLHGHIFMNEEWSCSSVVGHNVLENKTIAKAIGDWYFDRSSFQHIDTTNDVPRNCTSTLTSEELCKECIHQLN
ncbi:hypothetical protein BUALT_Bualt10G0082000 [Buddleja alternifolia]|uniref:Pectin acetylesterase n=1 Tax=Buddleja alternifolia TaxID=168488 RepID=A0AAV6X1N4_9LAMI|nr:hypothetical protein BUALT_Bualt10G0082000 [Buddleja alternifolia]